MSLFLKAMQDISQLARQADVIGEPRISLSFDNEPDKARFKRELERDINNTIALRHDKIINASEFKMYGITVRIL
jgi:hypothetical protein